MLATGRQLLPQHGGDPVSKVDELKVSTEIPSLCPMRINLTRPLGRGLTSETITIG